MKTLMRQRLGTLRVLLAVLLLAAQSASFAHGLSHAGDIDTGMCRACTLYSGVNGITNCAEIPAVQPAPRAVLMFHADTGITIHPSLPGLIRAPPSGQQ